jgi:hypothetical protein
LRPAPRISNNKETSSNQTPDPISMRHRISPFSIELK